MPTTTGELVLVTLSVIVPVVPLATPKGAQLSPTVIALGLPEMAMAPLPIVGPRRVEGEYCLTP